MFSVKPAARGRAFRAKHASGGGLHDTSLAVSSAPSTGTAPSQTSREGGRSGPARSAEHRRLLLGSGWRHIATSASRASPCDDHSSAYDAGCCGSIYARYLTRGTRGCLAGGHARCVRQHSGGPGWERVAKHASGGGLQTSRGSGRSGPARSVENRR